MHKKKYLENSTIFSSFIPVNVKPSIFLISLQKCCNGGSAFAIVVPPTVGTLPSGQQKLDHVLDRNSPTNRAAHVLTQIGVDDEKKSVESKNEQSLYLILKTPKS